MTYLVLDWIAADWTSKYIGFLISLKKERRYIYILLTKIYVPPAFVTAVTDGENSKRVEDSCVEVTTKFDEYIHTYQRSTKFDVGIKTSTFSLVIAAYQDVKYIYEALKNLGVACMR